MQRRKFLAGAIALSTLATRAVARQPKAVLPKKAFSVKAGEGRFGEKTKLMGISPNDIKVSAKDTDGKLTIFEYTGREKGGPPLHVHPNQDEIFYVLAGQYQFQVGNEKQELSAGDTIFLPRNVPHTFAQRTDSGRLLFFLQPDTHMEDYFRAVGKLTAKTAPQEGASLFASHDMKVVGPPLTLH